MTCLAMTVFILTENVDKYKNMLHTLRPQMFAFIKVRILFRYTISQNKRDTHICGFREDEIWLKSEIRNDLKTKCAYLHIVIALDFVKWMDLNIYILYIRG
jgi:hypothetical protein